jgi:hypothetical protein
MRLTLTIMGAVALFLTALTDEAFAGDKNSIYFEQQSGLFRVGFSGKACGSFPMPSVSLDGERSCARVPLTYMHVKTDENGNTTKEVLKLEDYHDEQCTRGIDAAGNPTETCSIKVVSGRSIEGDFGRKQNFSLMGATFGDASSDSQATRRVNTGLAAARRSTQESE